MKTSTIALSAALLASLAGGVWLYAENGKLRDELAGLPAPAAKTAAPAKRMPPLNAPAHSAGAKPPAGQGSAPSAVAVPSGSPAATGAAAALTAFVVAGNEDGTVTITDPATGLQKQMTLADLSKLTQQAQAAAVEHTIKKPGGPSWSPGNAAGAPNTNQHGDYPTAWAAQSQDGGLEWLKLKYARSVEVAEINIHETYNPGAVSKVSAIMPDGSERTIWQGTATPEDGVVERAVKVPPGIRSDQIRIELDTARVPGWNEIDAVELVGRDGSRQWAAESTASSYYGAGYSSFSTGLMSSDLSGVEYEGLRLVR